MISSMFHRHPRYALALAVGIIVLLLLGVSDHSTLGYPPRLEKAVVYGSEISLKGKLEEAERDYQATIARRPELIAKFGKSVNDLEPFPTNGDFYTVWDFWLPAFPCPHKVERIGTLGDGGKYMCGLDRLRPKRDCVVYSFGVNGESSYEAAILSRLPRCEVYGYDFSVESFGPEIDKDWSLKQRSHFWQWGISGKNAHGPHDKIKMYTLETLMRMNGHAFIDILKIDIEGAEFDALTDIIDHYSSMPSPKPLPFGQLQLEIHARDAWGKDLPKLLKWFERLEEAGLRPFWTEPNMVYMNVFRGGQPPDLAEYSFINIRGDHELISDS